MPTIVTRAALRSCFRHATNAGKTFSCAKRAAKRIAQQSCIKGQHILIRPEEIDELKLEAKHTTDMGRFVDEADIDIRYFEKPYYLLPDGESADEGYTVMREALAKSGKAAVG